MLISMIRKQAGLFISSLALLTQTRAQSFGAPSLNQGGQPLTQSPQDTQYDVAIIGGGSGGMSFAFQASKFGLNTVLFDYVKETPHKTKWGIGGTCVNVGCIPKKLIHQSTILGESIRNAYDYGWDLGVNSEENAPKLVEKFSWEKLIKKVNAYIRSLNFGYKNNLEESGVKYLNCLATLIDKNTILCSKDITVIEQYLKTGQLPDKGIDPRQPNYFIVKTKSIVIATGTKPTYLSEKQCKGSKIAITSDDLFWMKKKPGNTLVVGGGYVAVEIAGFLAELGFNVSMMTRGDYLRSFDKEMVAYLLSDMKNRKVNIVPTSLPKQLTQDPTGTITATIVNQVTNAQSSMNFNTVVFAVGRNANTQYLNADKVGLKLNPKNGKIVTSHQALEKTSIDNIFAIGDVVDGIPQLTGTVQKAGRLLAKKLAADHKKIQVGKKEYKTLTMDYKDFPTTVFTPIEYSVCGMSEEQAIKALGEDNVEVYHSKILPLEQSILDKYDEDGNDHKIKAYLKVITDNKGNVLGLHYAGPNAGQVMQGYAVAMRMGLTKQMLDRTVGIHPTVSEEFTNLKVTKRSGDSAEKKGC